MTFALWFTNVYMPYVCKCNYDGECLSVESPPEARVRMVADDTGGGMHPTIINLQAHGNLQSCNQLRFHYQIMSQWLTHGYKATYNHAIRGVSTIKLCHSDKPTGTSQFIIIHVIAFPQSKYLTATNVRVSQGLNIISQCPNVRMSQCRDRLLFYRHNCYTV